MKQPKLRASCKQIFCKSEARFLGQTIGLGAYWLWRLDGMTRHEFLVKKFERTLLHAVQYNRLRRFGRWHEFFWKLFLL